MVLISLFAISAVSASDSDNITTMGVSAEDNEIEIIDVDENLNANEALSAGEDNVNDVQLNLIVENITYDELPSINVTVVDNTGTIDFTQSTVEIFVDEKFICYAPISSTGQSGVILAEDELDAGSHYVKATLVNGSDKILTNDAFFNIAPATPVVTVEDIIVNVYENVTVPFNVTDKKGKGISGEAIVTIFWASDSLSKRVPVVDGSGIADFDFTGILGIITSMNMEDMMSSLMGDDAGGFNFEDMFGGNGTFDPSKFANMNFSDMFGNGSGNKWADMFSGNGSGNPMESMMSVSFDYIFTPGNYNVTTTFLGDKNYDTVNATSNLTITYLEDVVYSAKISTPKYLGNDTVVTINVIDKFSNPIPNIVVFATVDGQQTLNATLNDKGTAKVSFKNIVNGNHTLVLESTVNGTTTNQTFDFNVQVNKANVTIEAKDITVTTVNINVDGKIGKYFSATLKDQFGNVLNNKTVQISIDNKKYNVTTNEEGVAKLQINIANAGTYTCTVAFLQDDSYKGAFDIAKVTVNKQTAKLTVAKKTYKAKAKTKKVTATFKSAKGKAIKNKKITFKIKGKTYTAKTNSKGVATINVKLTKKGTYTVVAKFAGDKTYKSVSKNGKLILK